MSVFFPWRGSPLAGCAIFSVSEVYFALSVPGFLRASRHNIFRSGVFDEWGRTRPRTGPREASFREDVMQKHVLKFVFAKAALAAAALGAFLFLAGAPAAKANDRDDCNRRAAYADWQLRVSIGHFGTYSPQASYWRHERHEAYERLERYRRHEWREHQRREWREQEWREHHRDSDGRRYYQDRD
jgi:hypothetical protein